MPHPINNALDKKVMELRRKGLSFREIGKLVNKDVKDVYRRYKRQSVMVKDNL